MPAKRLAAVMVVAMQSSYIRLMCATEMRRRIAAAGRPEAVLPTSDAAGTANPVLLHIVPPSDFPTNCSNGYDLTQGVFCASCFLSYGVSQSSNAGVAPAPAGHAATRGGMPATARRRQAKHGPGSVFRAGAMSAWPITAVIG